MLVAGIDGGQSSSEAAIADERGRILGRGIAGPADEIGAGPESTRLRDALAGALHAAMREAGVRTDTKLEAIVAGISGYEGRVYGVEPDLPSSRVILLHDAPIAHAGALGGAPGVVVIAGTGSVAYGRTADGRESFAGGWGYVFGDEGSAFWIARNAVAIATTHDACEGVEQILSFFDVHSLRELVRGFYTGAVTRDEFASFARRCIAAAREGDGCSCLHEPVRDAASELAALAQSAVVDLESPFAVAFTGGLMRDAWFKSTVYAATRERLERAGAPTFEIVEPMREPVEGAVVLALRAAGVEGVTR